MRMARNVASMAVLGSLSLLAACGDPVPPAAQAGVSIHIQEYDPMDPIYGMNKCPPSRHWVNVPYDRDRPPTSQKQLTDGNQATRAVNNQDGNKVTCAVRPSGSGFKVTASGSAYAESDGTKYKPSIVNISIPNISSGQDNATGFLSIQDDASIVLYETTQCNFSVQGESLGVDAGKNLGRVRCVALADDSSPGAACQVDTGYFVFENCAQ